jgi:hypothetical protein
MCSPLTHGVGGAVRQGCYSRLNNTLIMLTAVKTRSLHTMHVCCMHGPKPVGPHGYIW